MHSDETRRTDDLNWFADAPLEAKADQAEYIIRLWQAIRVIEQRVADDIRLVDSYIQKSRKA